MGGQAAEDCSITHAEIAAHDDQRDIGKAGWASLRALYAEEFDGTVLDAGGGTGIYASALDAAGLDVVLADVDERMLAAARGRGLPAHRVVQADMTALPFADASFDGAHVAHVLHVVDEWRRAIGEVSRVVRPGGAVLLALGGAHQPGPELGEISARVDEEIGGMEAVTRGQARGLNSPEDADHAFALSGLDLAAIRRIDGVHGRALGQVIDRMLLNPYRSTASREGRARAAERITAWAKDHFGSLEREIDVPVGIEYRIYRRRS
ncbi:MULTISPECIES: class I SAM-dependent methyltransferase [unclassified Brachybacterium]|uniref:class I SAM-dependent methyltransferase n=1 Tax=unclassified Brachybacterium TaxID=2623841 RepID=UPI004033C8C5